MCDEIGCGPQSDKPPIVVTDLERRAFLAGAAALPLAAVLSYPDLAAAQAATVTPTEFALGGGEFAKGVIAMPEKMPAPAVVLIHEWWGLNDSIKAVAAELASLGYIAFAIDLHDGKVATEAADARALTQSVPAETRTAHLAGAIAHLRSHDASNGKVGVIGWCFGGGWSLNASIAAPVDATVIYYGRVTRPAADLKTLKGPVLGHFGTLDAFIDEKMVGGFEREMAAAGKADQLTVHWYTANHAFANPSGGRYDEDDAALAWSRTQAFFAKNLNP